MLCIKNHIEKSHYNLSSKDLQYILPIGIETDTNKFYILLHLHP